MIDLPRTVSRPLVARWRGAGTCAVLLLGLAGCVGAPGPAPTYVAAPQQVAGTAPAPGIPYGATCYAGFYTCALPASLPIGTGCSCPGLGAPSYGVVR